MYYSTIELKHNDSWNKEQIAAIEEAIYAINAKTMVDVSNFNKEVPPWNLKTRENP